MRIAILGSVSSRIPPAGQAGIERGVYHQALGLASRGHSILLFALDGSSVPHKNVEVVSVGQDEALLGKGSEKTDMQKVYGVAYSLRVRFARLAKVVDILCNRENRYDIILSNLPDDAVSLFIKGKLQKPLVQVTRLPLFPEIASQFKEKNIPLISLSLAQQKAFPKLNYIANIYNGVDTEKFTFSPSHKDYLLFLGSIGKNKNPLDAILAAKEAGERLLLGGRIKDKDYFDNKIKPHVDNKQILWLGEVSSDRVIDLYQGAKAFLFPIMWEEPFGNVVIEALSCGTPVIGYNHGAIPEIIVDGKTGYVVENSSQMIVAIQKVAAIKREACREHAEKNFSLTIMINAYERVLTKIGEAK